MKNVPTYLDFAFIFITLATAALFWWVIRRGTDDKRAGYGRIFLIASGLWLTLQGVLAYRGVYASALDVLPPRIALFGIIPTLVIIIALLVLPAAQRFLRSLPLREMSLLHTIRIPVELVLYGLFVAKVIPEVMTFAGRNFDILAGLSAPLVYLYAFRPKRRKNLLIVWNLLCTGLLLSVVLHAFFAAPFPLQQIAFDQPNIGVLHFPYVWLPTYVVPVVLFCHFASLRTLFSRKG